MKKRPTCLNSPLMHFTNEIDLTFENREKKRREKHVKTDEPAS